MITTGGFAALGLTGAGYVLALSGIGILGAGVAGGIYVYVKSDWKRQNANEIAVKQVLTLMEKGKKDMVIQIRDFWYKEMNEIKKILDSYFTDDESKDE